MPVHLNSVVLYNNCERIFRVSAVNSNTSHGAGAGAGNRPQIALTPHRQKLNDCQTFWLGSYSDKIRITQNTCGHRDCVKDFCSSVRFAKNKKLFKRYFDATDKPVRFVTLTLGQHRELNRETMDSLKLNVKNYLRRVSYKRKDVFVLSVIEAKRKPDGLYHLHCHMAFFGYCPHHLKTTKIWAEVLGRHASTDTRYRTKRNTTMNYMLRRVVFGGIDWDADKKSWGSIPEKDYMDGLYRRKVWWFTGRFKKFVSNLEVYGNKSTKAKGNSGAIFLGSLKKRSWKETIPPPDVFEHFLAVVTGRT